MIYPGKIPEYKDDQFLEAKKQGQDTLALERQVDELVYKLYGITEEERRVIDGEE